MSTPAQAERNPLRIEQMTVFDIEPEEVVTLAEGFGVSLISLWTTNDIAGCNPVTEANKRAVLARLQDSPVRVDTVEVFMLSAALDKAEPSVALAAELGARAIVAINLDDTDEARTAGQLAGLCELAARYGLAVSVEPVANCATSTPAQGLRLIERSGAANTGLTIDLLHMFRSGVPMSEVAALPAGLVSSAQICDGPATITPDQWMEEGAFNRLPPGAGVFPVEDFLRALPNVPLGVEVPMRTLRERGVSARERTQRVLEATRAAQARAFS